MRRRIVVLSSNDAHHRYLADLLASRFNVVGHVIEPAAAQRRRLLGTKRYRDYAYTQYHHARRSLLGLDAYRAGYFGDLPPVPEDRRPTVLEVDWINEPRVVEFLSKTQPDLTIVICTSILQRQVIEAAGGRMINVHGGYLPYYRGNHCFFFALYRGEFDKIGSSIHYVDVGIDTGDLVEVVQPAIEPDDNAEKLYCRAEKLAIHRLVEWIEFWERGGALPRIPQGVRTSLNRTRDRKPYHDVLLWLRRRLGTFVVPSRSAPPLRPVRDIAAQPPSPARRDSHAATA